MEIHHCQSLDELFSQDKLSLAIGMFDGVHNGHHELLSKTVQQAKSLKLKAAVWTFSNIKKSNFNRINHPDFLLKKLREIGIEAFYEIPFTPQISSLTAEQFLESILIKKLNVKSIFLGENAKLGYQRKTSAQDFSNMAIKKNIQTTIIPIHLYDNRPISSTWIRQLITNGELKLTSKLLGYPYTVSGYVKKHQQLARQLGFPTANIPLKGFIHPPYGVYACKVLLPHSNQTHKAIAYFGSRPSINGNDEVLLEVHLINQKIELYDQFLEVSHFKYLRAEKKFPSLDQLKEQIKLDIEKV